MDLIYRADAINAANDAADDWDGGPNKGREEIIRNGINAIPSVPAVPLDKLCVWLAKFGCPCEINEGMCDDAHGVDRCLGIFNSSAFCWQYWLTKMMEEQDATD